MRMQTTEVGTYKITIYRNNEGLWEFWIKQNGHMLVKSTGTEECEETKRLLQKHLFDVVMTKKEKKHFDPDQALEWQNPLVSADHGRETAG
jgi:hypothetical protein